MNSLPLLVRGVTSNFNWEVQDCSSGFKNLNRFVKISYLPSHEESAILALRQESGYCGGGGETEMVEGHPDPTSPCWILTI